MIRWGPLLLLHWIYRPFFRLPFRLSWPLVFSRLLNCRYNLWQDSPPNRLLQHPTRKEASTAQADSDQGEDYTEDIEFSEGDDLPPDNPAFTGLFRPSLFKSLLHKARLTTNLGAPGVDSLGAPSTPGPHDALFHSSKPDKDVIPCPRLFLDVLQSPWGQPGSLTSPSTLDKKLYCAAPELEDLLALPTVDAPVASLSSSSVISTDSLDGLRAEDRWSELAFRKSHQAVGIATATSFFTRASLI